MTTERITYMQSARITALAESNALRAWARAGVPPRGGPINRWTEYLRHQHHNATTRIG